MGSLLTLKSFLSAHSLSQCPTELQLSTTAPFLSPLPSCNAIRAGFHIPSSPFSCWSDNLGHTSLSGSRLPPHPVLFLSSKETHPNHTPVSWEIEQHSWKISYGTHILTASFFALLFEPWKQNVVFSDKLSSTSVVSVVWSYMLEYMPSYEEVYKPWWNEPQKSSRSEAPFLPAAMLIAWHTNHIQK